MKIPTHNSIDLLFGKSFVLRFHEISCKCYGSINIWFTALKKRQTHYVHQLKPWLLLNLIEKKLLGISKKELPLPLAWSYFSHTSDSLKFWRYFYITIRGTFNKFPEFFVQEFQFARDSWKFCMLLLYILWDDTPISMISGSTEQLQQQLEYTLLMPDCHSWWISKMQSGRGDNLEEWYAIKFLF